MKKEKFNIQGMTCSSCSAHVGKAVEKLEGMKNVNVNLLSNDMTVEYDEKKLNSSDIIQSVIDAGYGATLFVKEEGKQQKKEKELKDMKHRLILSIIFLIPLMYLAMYHMFYEWFGIPIPSFIHELFHGNQNALCFTITQLILLLPIVWVNRKYFIIGFKQLIKRTPNMDSLIALGSSAAILYGVFAIIQIFVGLNTQNMALVEQYGMDIYFESAGTILTLITLGKYLETKSKGKTSQAITKLMNLAPKTALVMRAGKEETVLVEDVKEKEILLIKPGASIPVDGKIIKGNSSVDQSAITGESIPQEKQVGDRVIAGTINKTGFFEMEAEKVGENTTLAEIIRLVEEAANSKAPISKLADKVSGIFVPIVIGIAILATIIWLLVGQGFEFAISIGIAVLVISCPCALGLATPVAIMVGTGKAAEHGILIKTAESLELLHQVQTVVLDKTGTVTKGKPVVTDLVTGDGQENELLIIAGSMEQKSEHPLAEAILEEVKKKNLSLYELEEFNSIPGRGLKAKIQGKTYYAGNQAWMQENHIENQTIQTNDFAQQGKTPLYFAKENQLLGVIAVADPIKETSTQAIKALKKMGLEVVLLTGDNKQTAEAIGKQIGVEQVIAEVLPQEKEKEVVKLQNQGKKVAFVGDGINDSPALARSNVGLAIGSGTDIAIESADMVLMKNDLFDVITAIELSKDVIRNIKMNLFWAFFYNTIGIPIATGVLYPSLGLRLNPMIAAGAMSLSSVCVVTNALRLRNFKPTFQKKHVKTNQKEEEEIMKKTIIIEGMQCEHCKMAVEKALQEIEEVREVKVNLEQKSAVITLEQEITDTQIKEVIEKAGYQVKEIK